MPIKAISLIVFLHFAHAIDRPQDAVAMLQGGTIARPSAERLTIDANGEEEEVNTDELSDVAEVVDVADSANSGETVDQADLVDKMEFADVDAISDVAAIADVDSTADVEVVADVDVAVTAEAETQEVSNETATADKKVGDVSMMAIGHTGRWFGIGSGPYADGYAAGRADQAAAGESYADGHAVGLADQQAIDLTVELEARGDQAAVDEKIAEEHYAAGMADQAVADGVQDAIDQEIQSVGGLVELSSSTVEEPQAAAVEEALAVQDATEEKEEVATEKLAAEGVATEEEGEAIER